jgi:hypothetical protein
MKDLLQTDLGQAVFARLQRARQRQPVSQRAWSADWEDLLEEAGILSAEDRAEAMRLAVALAAKGWLELKRSKRGDGLRRVALPLERERDWFHTLELEHPAELPDNRESLSGIRWVPELAFLASTRVGVPAQDLLRLQVFFEQVGANRLSVPIKERSLEIFGDEKRLDMLRGSALFDEGRLSLDSLRCFVAVEPLGWERGPSPDKPVIVLENAATWHSYCRWNRERSLFSAVVYGGGNRFMDSVTSLEIIFRELGGPRPVHYFGDLDPQGLRIPRVASERATVRGLCRVQPHKWSYRQLLRLGLSSPDYACIDAAEGKVDPPLAQDLAWLEELRSEVEPLLTPGLRLPQERVGWEFLSTQADCVSKE